MKTKRQEELVHSFLSTLGDASRPLYQEIITCLSELGYNPQKGKENISFKHDLHNKQIAKMGVKKAKEPSPFFALRFSACNGYPKRFADIVHAIIARYPSRAARCMDGDCNYCRGEPDTHTYSCAFTDGERKSSCGAYALEIPGITADDIEAIKSLIKEEHTYLLKHEAGIPAT